TLGPEQIPARVIEVIRAEDPDVVMLQEVGPQLSMALRDQLRTEYPYQVRAPSSGVSGMATISKLPLRERDEQLPLRWVGPPQVMSLDWQGQHLSLVNVHMNIPPFAPELQGTRELQAQALVDYARRA